MSHHTDDPTCPLCTDKLKTAHEYMQTWFLAVKEKYKNVHISCAWRGPEDQEKAFLEGASKLKFPKSAHNHTENFKPKSLALDLFLINEDGEAVFPPLWYARLNADNESDHLPIQWGGKWKTLGDACHFQYQLQKPLPSAA